MRPLLLFVVCTLVAAAESRPAAHRIAGVPLHVQINGIACGPGALTSCLDHLGPQPDQKAVADVARSSSIGTYCFDVLRTAHFSAMSAAQGRFFPSAVPIAGFAGQPLGYAAFAHAAPNSWLEEAKSLVASDLPVLLLMRYAPADTVGHYRILIGYDDARREARFVDPWGRDQRTVADPDGTVRWSYDDLEVAWNYAAYGTSQPYWGMVMLPWSVRPTLSGALDAGGRCRLVVDIAYPCPAPFSRDAFPATAVQAAVTLPEGLSLEAGQGAQVVLADLPAGGSVRAEWRLVVSGPVVGEVQVTASGEIAGAVPEARWAGQAVAYPPYAYRDRIGGRGSVAVAPSAAQ